jgi:hypothetical protein
MVACGQRAASHSPASGLVAVGVPASFRQRALAGSVNQHYGDKAVMPMKHAGSGYARAFMLARSA